MREIIQYIPVLAHEGARDGIAFAIRDAWHEGWGGGNTDIVRT